MPSAQACANDDISRMPRGRSDQTRRYLRDGAVHAIERNDDVGAGLKRSLHAAPQTRRLP
jgi:hypothetical protein